MNKLSILATLTIQTTAHLLFVRYTRSKEGELYLGSSVVTVCEVLKLIASFVIVLHNVSIIHNFPFSKVFDGYFL